MEKTPIIIIGGKNPIAPYLIERMKAAKLEADVVSRSPLDLPVGFHRLPSDFVSAKGWKAPKGTITISLIPLDIMVRSLERFSEAHSVIALSSTRRFSRADSEDPYERAQAENLELAENILKAWCLRNGKPYTILRPTLVYDGKNDDSVTLIARIINRLGIFPIAAPAKGLRQPIHADDVAKAIMGAIGNAGVYNKELNIAGNEILTFRKMVENIFTAMGMRPRLLMLPSLCLQAAYKLADSMGVIKEKSISPETFKRMNRDQIYDVEEGLRLLEYSPRGFDLNLAVV